MLCSDDVFISKIWNTGIIMTPISSATPVRIYFYLNCSCLTNGEKWYYILLADVKLWRSKYNIDPSYFVLYTINIFGIFIVSTYLYLLVSRNIKKWKLDIKVHWTLFWTYVNNFAAFFHQKLIKENGMSKHIWLYTHFNP